MMVNHGTMRFDIIYHVINLVYVKKAMIKQQCHLSPVGVPDLWLSLTLTSPVIISLFRSFPFLSNFKSEVTLD